MWTVNESLLQEGMNQQQAISEIVSPLSSEVASEFASLALYMLQIEEPHLRATGRQALSH